MNTWTIVIVALLVFLSLGPILAVLWWFFAPKVLVRMMGRMDKEMNEQYSKKYKK